METTTRPIIIQPLYGLTMRERAAVAEAAMHAANAEMERLMRLRSVLPTPAEPPAAPGRPS